MATFRYPSLPPVTDLVPSRLVNHPSSAGLGMSVQHIARDVRATCHAAGEDTPERREAAANYIAELVRLRFLHAYDGGLEAS